MAKKKTAKKKAPSRALAVHDPRQQQTPATGLALIIQAASDPRMPVEKVERLYAIHKEERDKRERAEYDEAIRMVQAEVGPITRDKKGERSPYASLENISARLDPIAIRHGFSLSYGSEPSAIPDHYAMTCIVSHAGGHWRKYQLDLPADSHGPEGKPNKTKVQGVASSTSYARRILKTMIFNITIAGVDIDGAGTPKQPTTIGAKQVQELQALANSTGTPTTRILNYVSELAKEQITMLQDIPANCFDRVMTKMRQATGK